MRRGRPGIAVLALGLGAAGCELNLVVAPAFPEEPTAEEHLLARVRTATGADFAWLGPELPRLFPTTDRLAEEVAAAIYGPEAAWFAGSERPPTPDTLVRDAPPDAVTIPLPPPRRAFLLADLHGEAPRWEPTDVFAGLSVALDRADVLACFRGSGGAYHRRRGCDPERAPVIDGGHPGGPGPESTRLCAADGPACPNADPPDQLEDCKACLVAEQFCARDLGLRACRPARPGTPRRPGAFYVSASPPWGDGLSPETPARDLGLALATRSDVVLLPGRYALSARATSIEGRRVRISGAGVGTSTVWGWFQVGSVAPAELELEDLSLESPDPLGNGLMLFSGRAALRGVHARHVATGTTHDDYRRGMLNVLGADAELELSGVVIAPTPIGEPGRVARRDVESLAVFAGRAVIEDAQLLGPVFLSGPGAEVSIRDALIAPRHQLGASPIQRASWAIRAQGGRLTLAEVALDAGGEIGGRTSGGILATRGATVSVEALLIHRARAGIELDRARLEGAHLAIEDPADPGSPPFGLWARGSTVSLTRVEIDEPRGAGIVVTRGGEVELSELFIDDPGPVDGRSGVAISVVGARLALRRSTLNDPGARAASGRPAVALESFGGAIVLEDVLVKGPPTTAGGPGPVALAAFGGTLELRRFQAERVGLLFGVSRETALRAAEVEAATVDCLVPADGPPWGPLVPELAIHGLGRGPECAQALPNTPFYADEE